MERGRGGEREREREREGEREREREANVDREGKRIDRGRLIFFPFFSVCGQSL